VYGGKTAYSIWMLFGIMSAVGRPIPRPTHLTIPNGDQIQSAVLQQYTFWTDGVVIVEGKGRF